MDIEKFMDKNRIQIRQNRINRIAGDNIKVRDIISLTSLVQLLIPVVAGFQLLIKLLRPFVEAWIIPFGKSLWSSIDYAFFGKDFLMIYKPTYFSVCEIFVSELDFFCRGFVVIIGSIILKILCKKESINNFIITTCFYILAYMFLINEYKLIIIVIIALFLLTFAQVGTNRPYLFINNIFLFINLFFDDEKSTSENNKEFKESEKLSSKEKFNFFLWIIGYIGISIIVTLYFDISPTISFLLIALIIIRFGVQITSSSPKKEVAIKMSLYIIIFFIVLLTAETSDKKIDSIASVATVGITIYFAIDRLFELYKNVVQILKEESVDYYLIENTQKDSIDQYIHDEILYSSIDTMSDEEVLIQAIIRAKLNLSDSFEKFEKVLCNNNRFVKYKLILMSLDFYLKKEKDKSLSIIEFVEDYKEEILFNTQKIIPIKFVVELGKEYKEKENYEMASGYLRYSEYYSSLEYIKDYYACVKELDNQEEINRLEKEYILN